MSEVAETPCWIIHQPGRGGHIVADRQKRNIMFRNPKDAMQYLMINALFIDGYVCQMLPNARQFQLATIMDGQDAAWFDRENVAGWWEAEEATGA